MTKWKSNSNFPIFNIELECDHVLGSQFPCTIGSSLHCNMCAKERKITWCVQLHEEEAKYWLPLYLDQDRAAWVD